MAAVTSWLRPVAMAAPLIPQWRPSTKTASSTMLVTAPTQMPKVERTGCPSALMSTSMA